MVDLEPFAGLKLCGLSLNRGRFGLRHCHPVGVFVVGRFKCAARFDKKKDARQNPDSSLPLS